jgi:aryl-alcohol dehydrogenase-like predicted oxidoreductase
MLPIPGTSQVSHLEENLGSATVKIDDGEFQGLTQAA